MKRNSIILILIVWVTIGVFGFLFNKSSQPKTNTVDRDKKHQLLVTILPQKQIVERISGSDFVVSELVPPGFSPATYDPTTEKIKLVTEAEIYFRTGHLPFEKTHLEKLKEVNAEMLVVDTSTKNILRELEDHDHDHGDEEEHEEEHETDHSENLDPHTWLSPKMVKKQAEVIYNSLLESYPDKAEEFTQNYEQLIMDLGSLDKELELALAPIAGKTMLVYHPAFGYLARDYGFIQEHIEIEGKDPSIDDIQDIINEAREEDADVIFVQKQFSQDSAKAIADSIDGVVVEIDPLAPDYFNNMKQMAKTISEALD